MRSSAPPSPRAIRRLPSAFQCCVVHAVCLVGPCLAATASRRPAARGDAERQLPLPEHALPHAHVGCAGQVPVLELRPRGGLLGHEVRHLLHLTADEVLVDADRGDSAASPAVNPDRDARARCTHSHASFEDPAAQCRWQSHCTGSSPVQARGLTNPEAPAAPNGFAGRFSSGTTAAAIGKTAVASAYSQANPGVPSRPFSRQQIKAPLPSPALTRGGCHRRAG